jgi:hypothetical protein
LTAEGSLGRTLHMTWEWTGKHWTLRQDIGPGPRAGHAMAFDSTRNRVVLFGGLRTFDPNPSDELADTWEHVDGSGSGSAPTPPDGPFEFTLQPTTVAFGNAATATLVVAPQNETRFVQMSYTTAVLLGLHTPLPPVLVPAQVTSVQVSLPLREIQNNLEPNGFAPPADVTISAVLDGVTKTAVLRIVPA